MKSAGFFVLELRCNSRSQILLFPALLCSLTAFASDCEKNFFFGGVPMVTRTLPGDTIVVLTNCGYVVGYSEARRDPLWAAYRVKKVGKVGEQAENPERKNNFRSDKRTTIRVVDDDYTNSGMTAATWRPVTRWVRATAPTRRTKVFS